MSGRASWVRRPGGDKPISPSVSLVHRARDRLHRRRESPTDCCFALPADPVSLAGKPSGFAPSPVHVAPRQAVPLTTIGVRPAIAAQPTARVQLAARVRGWAVMIARSVWIGVVVERPWAATEESWFSVQQVASVQPLRFAVFAPSVAL